VLYLHREMGWGKEVMFYLLSLIRDDQKVLTNPISGKRGIPQRYLHHDLDVLELISLHRLEDHLGSRR
jgi:hypothetical protein